MSTFSRHLVYEAMAGLVRLAWDGSPAALAAAQLNAATVARPARALFPLQRFGRRLSTLMQKLLAWGMHFASEGNALRGGAA